MAGQKKRIDVGMDLGSKSSEISCTGNGGIFNDAYICIAMFVPRISDPLTSLMKSRTWIIAVPDMIGR